MTPEEKNTIKSFINSDDNELYLLGLDYIEQNINQNVINKLSESGRIRTAGELPALIEMLKKYNYLCLQNEICGLYSRSEIAEILLDSLD